MEAKAYIKNVNVTPKKLRFLLPQIKKMKPYQALERLMYVEKKPARLLYKAIQSAMNNAKTTIKSEDSKLIFKTLTIEEGQKMRRYKAGGRGTVKPFKRRFAHIKVVLTVEKAALPAFTKAKGIKTQESLKVEKTKTVRREAVKKTATKK